MATGAPAWSNDIQVWTVPVTDLSPRSVRPRHMKTMFPLPWKQWKIHGHIVSYHHLLYLTTVSIYLFVCAK